MRTKTTRAFRTISEAGDELGLQPHVLRFWESKFVDITPIKRGGGRRFYRPEDIEFLRGIKKLLHDEKHPIKDVQKLIAKSGAARIVELGRSVEHASRDRDLSATTLVPDRISKPVESAPLESGPVGSAAPPVLESARKTLDPSPELTAPIAPTVAQPEPVRETMVPEPIVQDPTPVADMSGLTDALSRLKALRGEWDRFDGAAANKPVTTKNS